MPISARTFLALAFCLPAFGQSFEQPRQQLDFYGGASYSVKVDERAASVWGTQVRVNTGRLVGVGGFYNFSRRSSYFGANAAGQRTSFASDVHDYGAAVEVHAPTRVQPYILGTLGWVTARRKATATDYRVDVAASLTESHLAYGGGVGVRYHFNRHLAAFVETRLMRAAVLEADYFVRGTAGVSITLPR